MSDSSASHPSAVEAPGEYRWWAHRTSGTDSDVVDLPPSPFTISVAQQGASPSAVERVRSAPAIAHQRSEQATGSASAAGLPHG